MFPGQHHTRSGMPSRVTAMPMTIWGRSSRWSLDLPQVRNPASRPSPAASGAVRDRVPALVAGDRGVGLLRHEVRAGRVEEQQVDLEAEHLGRPGRRPPSPAARGSAAASPSPGSRHRRSSPAGPRSARPRWPSGRRPASTTGPAPGSRPARTAPAPPTGPGGGPSAGARIAGPMPSRSHSASSTCVPPSGRDSANSRPSAAMALAFPGSRCRATEATSRSSASRVAGSSRPKL